MLAAFAAALSIARTAGAYDVLASPCPDAKLTCEAGHLAFDRTDALPIEWMLDTGWVPANSPLQVHLVASLQAHTHVALSGELLTSWPKALTLEAPGDESGGLFDYDYGVIVSAQGKVSLNIASQSFSWTGNIPYVPQIDFDAKASQAFDAWGWEPGVSLSSKTPKPLTVAKVSLANVISSIPGIDGGFELDVGLDVDAHYVTKRIVLAAPDGTPITGAPMTADGQTALLGYLAGPSVELDVHPEGSLEYSGILHLIPSFWVQLFGQKTAIPVADIPVPFSLDATDWIFDSQRVHVPLPDLALPKAKIDFGEIDVGETAVETFPLWNAGEAKAAAVIASSNREVFVPHDGRMLIDPSATVMSAVSFAPTAAGTFHETLTITSNDPSSPMQTIELVGTARGPAIAALADPDQDSSCACRAAPSRADASAFGAFAAVGVLAFARAGRRSRRPQPRR